MFIYMEIVKTEYYQREKMKIKTNKQKQLNNNDRNIRMDGWMFELSIDAQPQ